MLTVCAPPSAAWQTPVLSLVRTAASVSACVPGAVALDLPAI